MESRIREIQEKYWAGETSVEEEKELKEYFRSQMDISPEANYFRHLKNAGEQKPDVAFVHPRRKIRMPRWLMSAAITVGLLAGAYLMKVYQDRNEFLVEDPQKALEITRQALMKVSAGMNKGTAYVDNIKKIDQAKQMVKYQTQPVFESGFFISNF